MRCRKTRLGRFIRRKTTSALLCAAGLGAVGCAGGHLDLSSRWPGIAARTGDERAAVAEVSKDTERDDAGRIEQTGLERILPFRRDAEAAENSRESSGGGRVFSAFVNRLPGRRKSTSDPFLDNRSVAEKPSSSAASDPRTPTAGVARTKPPTREVAARTTTPAPQRERSDAELWQMFNADVAGTASVRATAQNAAPARTPSPVASAQSRAPAATDSLPAWAREQPAQPQSRSNTRDLPTLVAQAQAPRNQQERAGRARVNPSSKPQTVPTAPAITRREVDQRLEQLLAEARSHQDKGDLFEAYRVAVIAEELAEREHIVFAPRQPRPGDIVHEIERLMQASLSAAEEAPAMAAPPTIVPQQPPAGPVAVAAPHTAAHAVTATSRTADPFADSTWQGQRPVIETAAAKQPAKTASTGGRFDSEFPALHEWRGVRANSPVSLAVGNTAAETINELPERVQQALATGDSAATGNRAPLLARAEAERDQMLAAGQGKSLFSGDLRTPALASASHPDLQPVAVPSPPPLDVAPRKTGMAAATAGAGQTSGGGLVWWVLGGLAVLTGGVALKYRQQPAGRR